MTTLTAKRILITGAARGIGRALAERLARAGCELILTDADSDALVDTARAIGPGTRAYLLDVTDRDSAAAVRAQILDDAGPIDVLINNAGVVRGGAFLDVSLDDHLLTYRVNTLAMVAMTHLYLPDLIARPEAHIVNTVSASAFIGLPKGSTYASSKWAALGFSESLRLELAQLGHDHIHVTAVCPSFVSTGMFDGAEAPVGSPSLTPDRLAELVFHAVEHNKPMLLAPASVRSVQFLRGVLPGRVFDWIAERCGVYRSMHNWTGHTPA